MTEGFTNSILGAHGVLERDEIRSTNYIPGVSGWRIARTGAAEFHGLAITGGSVVITGAGQGVFIYSGPPAPGNLIVSMAAAAGTDAHGNTYPQGFGVAAGAIPGTLIDAGTIGTAQIAPAAITNALLALSAVGTANIQHSAVTGALIAAAAVGTANIAAGAVTSAEIAAAAGILGSQLSPAAGITGSQLSPAAGITAGQIAFTARDIGGVTTTIAGAAPAGAKVGDLWFDSGNGFRLNRWDGAAWQLYQYGTGAIAAGSVTAALIAAHTITASQIAAGTITAAEIAAGTITASQIAAGTIVSSLLAANAVAAGQIAAGAVTAGTIAAGAVTATEIAAGTITAAQIAAGTITASQIAAGTIVSSLLAAGAVTAGQIAAGAIDGMRISGAQIIAYGATGDFLVYSGAPAAGNLVGSVSAAAGIDAHGNAYQAGIVSYGTGGFAGDITALLNGQAKVTGGAGDWALLSGGIVQLMPVGGTLCGSVQASDSHTLTLTPPTNPGTDDTPQILLISHATAPSIYLGPAGGTVHPVDVIIGGTLHAEAAAAGPEVWQIARLVLGYAANWAAGDTGGVFRELLFRKNALADLELKGSVHMTLAAGLAAGTYTITNALLAAAYRPNLNWRMPGAVHTSSANVIKAAAMISITAAGAIQITTSTAIAQNDNFYIGTQIPLAS